MMRQELLTPEIIKMARSLKRQIVEITPHYICGSDSIMATFSIIYLNGDVPVDDELYYLGPSNELTNYDNYLNIKHIYQVFKPYMDHKRSRCQFIENNRLLLRADDITKGQQHIIPGFAESMKMKAKQGVNILNIDNTDIFISSCPSIHPINKPDVVNIFAWEDDEISCMVRFDINKKKYMIHEYVRFLYL